MSLSDSDVVEGFAKLPSLAEHQLVRVMEEAQRIRYFPEV